MALSSDQVDQTAVGAGSGEGPDPAEPSLEGILRTLEGLSAQLDQIAEASLGMDHTARFAQLFAALSAIEERMDRLETLRRETPPQAAETLHRLSGEVARLRVALQDEERRTLARNRRERLLGLGLLAALAMGLMGLYLAS